MKSQPRFKTVEEVPLSPYEQAIEDATDENAPLQPISPEINEEFIAAARAALASMRGGKRPGSGRKPRSYIKTALLLSPAARARLESLAKTSGSLSAAAEKAIMALPGV